MAGRSIAGFLVAASLVIGGSARADRALSPQVTTTLGDGDVWKLTLVGRSGQLYFAKGDKSWQRTSAGGVSVDVIGAAGTVDQGVYVVGRRSPLFRLTDGVWSARPLTNHGLTSWSSRDAALSVGRHVYLHQRDGTWKRETAAPRTISALWVGGTKNIYVGLRRGDILRSAGRKWATLQHSLADDDYVVGIVGASPGDLYAWTKAGVLLHISGKTVTEVKVPDALPGFALQTAGVDSDGKAVLVARVTAPAAEDETAGTQHTVLVSASKGTLTRGEEIPLDAGDRVSIVRSDKAGNLLVASRNGSVRVRAKDGTWAEGRVSPDPPPGPALGTGVVPARTR